jgi:hypothetical protein
MRGTPVRAGLSALLAIGLWCGVDRSVFAADEAPAAAASPFAAAVAEDKPALRLDFATPDRLGAVLPEGSAIVPGAKKNVASAPGPVAPRFPLMGSENAAGTFASGSYLRLENSTDRLRIGQGGQITIEAWVRPTLLGDESNRYIIGKGRTGADASDQNWALRLRGEAGRAKASFLFRSADGEVPGAWHRWTSDDGFPVDGSWHHVAVSYVFGEPDSVRGYIDGRPLPGTWDMGGPTSAAPVVDAGEIWIGSALGGSAGNTFVGDLDEIAVYETALSAERIASRFEEHVPDPAEEQRKRLANLKPGVVRMAILEDFPAGDYWGARGSENSDIVYLDRLYVDAEPRKYGPDGAILARANPHVVRFAVKRELPSGEYEFVVRSRGQSRLILDGVVYEGAPPIKSGNADGYDKVYPLPDPLIPGMHLVPFGSQEAVVKATLEAGEHSLEFETLVGGKNKRAELSETLVAYRSDDGPYRVLAADPADDVELTEAWWIVTIDERHELNKRLNAGLRHRASAASQSYWRERHSWARQVVEELPPIDVPEVDGVAHPIDRFLAAKMKELGREPAALIDDAAFVRRATIDVLGRIATPDEIRRFEALPETDRRAKFIDELLARDEWADAWTPYWQDVLAENPGVLKPELNNTGPFRYWLYEAALDNLPMDRLATELLSMKGDRLSGGPGGFAMASQNDIPMASKAHIAAQAFLGIDMQCARCHDAPFHPWKQEQLLSLAAMLERKPITLPATSTVPPLPGGRIPAIEITLSPGDQIDPTWQFDQFPVSTPAEHVRSGDDTREMAAFLITSPENERFAQTIVNRAWKRLMGQGLVEPVDDWTQEEPSHPELLAWLGREFVRDGYDLKALYRRILTSDAYQRVATTPETFPQPAEERSFAAQTRRRLSAENLLDSLFLMAGKPFHCEPLTMEQEGRGPLGTFMHLGRPRKAWEFASPSGERDRPALILPGAQTLVDVLGAYGWRESRPSPISVRDEEPNVVQPLALANGLVPQRIFTLSDDHALTQVALSDISPEGLAEEMALRVWGRRPDAMVREALLEMIQPGFETRRRLDEPVTPSPIASLRSPVSWSNHLIPEATTTMLEIEKIVMAGDPPTKRLDPDWRMRVEDLLWAMTNSPEYVFVP